MKKNDFMQRLSDELQKRNVADAADILQEYEAHFAMKMADGYIEEEIAARLGDPTALAAQFDDAEETPEKKGGSKPLVVAGLCFADVFAGLFFILLAAWGLVLAAAALGAAGTAVCLLGKVELGGLLPELPYWCGAMLALTLAALAVLLAAGCVYFCAFLRQLMRSYGRFRKTRWPRPPARRGCPRCPSARSFPRKQDGGCVPWRWWRWHCLRCASCWRTSCAPCRREACSFGTRGAGLRNDQRRKNLQRNRLRAIFLFLEQQLICSQ